MTDKQDNAIEVADPFARQLMARYLDRRRQDIDHLHDALEAQDYKTIATIGHNLFGSGGAYGLEQVSNIGRCIESAAAREDADLLLERIAELHLFVQTVRILKPRAAVDLK